MSNNFDKKIEKNSNYFSLAVAELNKPCKIVRCTLPYALTTRFFEMGLTPNTKITVLKKAPAGDPLEIAVRGYSLCIRISEAENFQVVYVEPERNKHRKPSENILVKK